MGVAPGRERERSSNAMGGYEGESPGRYVSIFTFDLTVCRVSFLNRGKTGIIITVVIHKSCVE